MKQSVGALSALIWFEVVHGYAVGSTKREGRFPDIVGDLVPRMGALSAAELSYIEGGIAQNLRSDGRGRLDFRNISIVTGVIPQVIPSHHRNLAFFLIARV